MKPNLPQIINHLEKEQPYAKFSYGLNNPPIQLFSPSKNMPLELIQCPLPLLSATCCHLASQNVRNKFSEHQKVFQSSLNEEQTSTLKVNNKNVSIEPSIITKQVNYNNQNKAQLVSPGTKNKRNNDLVDCKISRSLSVQKEHHDQSKQIGRISVDFQDIKEIEKHDYLSGFMEDDNNSMFLNNEQIILSNELLSVNWKDKYQQKQQNQRYNQSNQIKMNKKIKLYTKKLDSLHIRYQTNLQNSINLPQTSNQINNSTSLLFDQDNYQKSPSPKKNRLSSLLIYSSVNSSTPSNHTSDNHIPKSLQWKRIGLPFEKTIFKRFQSPQSKNQKIEYPKVIKKSTSFLQQDENKKDSLSSPNNNSSLGQPLIFLTQNSDIESSKKLISPQNLKNKQKYWQNMKEQVEAQSKYVQFLMNPPKRRKRERILSCTDQTDHNQKIQKLKLYSRLESILTEEQRQMKIKVNGQENQFINLEEALKNGKIKLKVLKRGEDNNNKLNTSLVNQHFTKIRKEKIVSGGNNDDDKDLLVSLETMKKDRDKFFQKFQEIHKLYQQKQQKL